MESFFLDNAHVLGSAGGGVSLLLMMNFWLVRKLNQRLDRMDHKIDKIPIHQVEIKNMEKDISEVKLQVSKFSEEFKNLAPLRERVAVLEDRMKRGKRASHL